MSSTRITFPKVTTDEGVLVFPKINAPDTKFKADGEYQAKIRLDAEASQKLIEKYEAELAKYWEVAKAELEEKLAQAKPGAEKAKAKKALSEMKEADRPFKPAYDDEGNATDEYEFNFKMPAQFKSKKDGSVIKMKPDVFDASGKLLKNPPEIWGGTKACVAGELRPFSTQIGVGLSLRLKAVQIIELSSGGGGQRDAGGYGFGSKEGYEGSDEETSHGFNDRSSGGGSESGDGSDNEDF